MKNVIYVVSLVVGFVILVWLSVEALDQSFASQDKMLCESALVSGNSEYLSKCSCYYESGDINCIK